MKFSVDKAGEFLASKLMNLIQRSEDPIALRFAFAFAGSDAHAKAAGSDPKNLVNELRSTMRMMEGARGDCQEVYKPECARTVEYSLCRCPSTSGPLVEDILVTDCTAGPVNAACSANIQHEPFDCDYFKCKGDFRCSTERFDGCGQVYYQDGDGCANGSNFQCNDQSNNFQCDTFDCPPSTSGTFQCEQGGLYACWGSYATACTNNHQDRCELTRAVFYCAEDFKCSDEGRDFTCDYGEFHCASAPGDGFDCQVRYNPCPGEGYQCPGGETFELECYIQYVNCPQDYNP